MLAKNIKKTLDQAVKFRKDLAKSRKEFLQEELNRLKKATQDRGKEIHKLDKERTELFHFLEEKEAIKDLSSAYLELSKTKEKLGGIESKIKICRDMQEKLNQLNERNASIYSEISKLCDDIKDIKTKIRDIFFEIYNAIYVGVKDDSGFNFTANPKKASKVNIEVSLPKDLSYATNKGRTLIYDLIVLFYEIQNNINAPRFLIHDGIFDGIDKAHFVHLYEFLEQKTKDKIKYQYIITLNDEGDLRGEFGNIDKVNYKTIEDQAITVLTPSNTFFKKSWD